MDRPRLTIFTKTLDGASNLERVLPNYRQVADEVVVGVDSQTQDDSAEVARKHADTVFSFPHGCAMGGGSEPRSLFYELLFPHCSGDWILQLDHDETLSPEWNDSSFLEELLSNRSVTHAFFPRRWALPGRPEYIASRHWYPNLSLRLFRNIPSLLQVREVLHGGLQVAGEASYEANASIIHWVLAWTSREQRVQRTQFYATRSSNSGREYYLYEHQPFETRPLLDPSPDPRFEPDYPVTCEPRFRAAIRVLRAPGSMFAGEFGWVLIAIHNGSDRVLKPDSYLIAAFGLYICHHWLNGEEGSSVAVWDGERWPLPRRIHPGETALAWTWLRAPETPGPYRAQLDLIEEGVTWFSAHVPMPTIPIEVTLRPDESAWYPDCES